MTTQAYFRSKRTGREFPIVEIDKDAGEFVLQGLHTTFREPMDKERFERMEYELLSREVADTEPVAEEAVEQ